MKHKSGIRRFRRLTQISGKGKSAKIGAIRGHFESVFHLCSSVAKAIWLRTICAVVLGLLSTQTVRAAGSNPPPIVLTVEGANVWIQRFQSNLWQSAYPSEILRVKDRGRTGADSRTSIRLSDLSVLRIGWHSEFEIQPPSEPGVDGEFSLRQGLLRLLNRDRPGS